MEEKFIELDDGWRAQEIPTGYYLWFPKQIGDTEEQGLGNYLHTRDGQPLIFPTLAALKARMNRKDERWW